MADYKLYIGNKAYSSWSLRAWLPLRRIGVPFDEEVIPLRESDTSVAILRHSPSGRVPALEIGDLVVWESIAIGEYLAERHPEAGLWPEDRSARAMARSVAAEMHAGFAALRRSLPMNVRVTAKPKSPVTPEVEADADRMATVWTECRNRFGAEGPFLFGRFSIADAMFAPEVTRLTTWSFRLPDVAAGYARTILDMPEMKEWYAAALAEPWLIPEWEP